MAGIGFKLRQMTREEGLSGQFKGYLSAALICCGPWILTVATLCLTDALMALSTGIDVPNKFRLILVYVYAFSLISTGALQTTVTRYLADRLYAEEPQHHIPTLLAVTAVNTPLQALLAWLAVVALPLEIPFKVLSVALFVLVGNLWILMIFLGAIRAYEQIVGAFALGSLVALLAMGALSPLGELGFLLGYLLGQTVVYLGMLRSLLREFPPAEHLDFEFLRYFRYYPALAAAGFLLNLGTWVGVFGYWLSPHATWYFGLPSYYPQHDVALFLALLTIVPALVLFFVVTETEFYESYRAYFGGITVGKVRLSELQRRRLEMQETLQSGLGDLVKVQGIISLLVAGFPEQVFGFLQLPEVTYEILRNCAAGAFVLVLYQCAATLLLYYEAYARVAWSALALVLGNALGCAITLQFGTWTHGLGLLLGSTLALGLALEGLARQLKHLERTTFMRQPMPGQVVLSSQDSQEAFARTLMKDGRWLEDPS